MLDFIILDLTNYYLKLNEEELKWADLSNKWLKWVSELVRYSAIDQSMEPLLCLDFVVEDFVRDIDYLE